jgi:flagellar basal body-associated protein FliL
MAAIRPGRPAAKKQAAAPTDAAPPPPPPAAPRNRGMTVPAIVVAAALLGAAFLMRGGGGGTTVQASSTATTAPVAEGAVVALDPITMNLASGDILKVGIALQLAASTDAKTEAADPSAFGARALDETISVIGQYSRNELAAAGGIADAKTKLSKRVALVYHDKVIGVYFTQFVVA